MSWLRREIEITRFLDRAADPCGLVTRPCSWLDPGPFERAGLVLSFWEPETIIADRAEPAAAGAGLAALHRRLASYPPGALPEWGGVDEARQVFARGLSRGALDADEARRMHLAWDEAERVLASARARTASFQAVHGDAHIGNVLATARGAVWTDWEDAFVGPVEWDVACLRSKADLFGEERDAIDAMVDAYGTGFDAELASELGLVRNVQVIAWLAVFSERQPELAARMRARIARLPV